MASIIPVKGKWRALIRRKGHKTQCKTFAVKAQAERWARQVEAAMDSGPASPVTNAYTVSDAIKAFRRLREDSPRPILPTSNEHYVLKKLDELLGDKVVTRMTTDDLVAFANTRNEEGAGAYTINMDISKFGTVLRFAGSALKVVFPDVIGTARPTLQYLRLIGGGTRRTRRPAEDEHHAVLTWLAEHKGADYAEAVRFAPVSAMRRGEVCALTKGDIDVRRRLARVMRKHPRKGKVEKMVPLLGEAWEIVERRMKGLQPDDRLFAIHPQTLSKYFKEACTELGIPDLKLHDMRHEGTSALLEAGYSIPEAALVTGHEDWRSMQIYANLRPEDLTQPKRARSRSNPPRPARQRTDARSPRKSSPGKSQR